MWGNEKYPSQIFKSNNASKELNLYLIAIDYYYIISTRGTQMNPELSSEEWAPCSTSFPD